MEKRNGYKFFERALMLQSRLSKRDLLDLRIDRIQANKQANCWQQYTGSIIPGTNEGKNQK